MLAPGIPVNDDRRSSAGAPEDLYHLIVELAPHAMVLLDTARRIVMVNAQAESLFGYQREELLGQPAEMLAPERFRTQSLFAVDSLPTPFGLRSDGVEFPTEIALSTIDTRHGAFQLASIVDATGHRLALDDKTTMLKEVHHRVKNNLQVICSLLSMQIGVAEGTAALAALNDAYSRALSMALIHEQIYQSETVSDLNFGKYIDVLSQRLFSTYCVDATLVQLELSVDSVHLNPEHAVPCGLILSELISNALKHAFPGRRGGIVQITLKNAGDGRAELTVADNGIGLPPELNWETSPSVGMQVILTLVRQLRATLSVTTGDEGTSFRIGWDYGVRVAT